MGPTQTGTQHRNARPSTHSLCTPKLHSPLIHSPVGGRRHLLAKKEKMTRSLTRATLGMSIPTRKPKNARAKRALTAREPKLVEAERAALWLRGTSTSEAITAILKDLHDLKKPDSTNFSRRNDKRPFEDETSVEFLCQKNECSVFGFGSHSKKRPHNLILGRTYNYKIYDMYELALTDIKTSSQFKAAKQPTLGNRPIIVFQGDAFEHDTKFQELKGLFLDIFGHEAMQKINLGGIEHAIVLTAQAAQGEKEGKVAFRHYSVTYKKSGGRVPRVELEEVGPHFDMELRRTRPASAELQKEACKVPRQIQKSGKLKKNLEKNALGDTLGRVHMEKQDFDDFQVLYVDPVVVCALRHSE